MNKFLMIALCLALLVPVAKAEMESTISTDFTINSEAAPDTVKIKFYVENSGMNLADLKDKNDKIVNNAVAEIKKNLTADEHVKTIAYRVNNIYSYKDKIKVFQKYEISNGFEVKLKDMSKISQIIKIAMDNGVKRVDNLDFSLEAGQSICNNLISQATKSARQRAQVIATASDSQILKVKSINPYCSLNSNYVHKSLYANSAAKMTMDAGAAAPEAIEIIEPGSISIRAGVSATYYLK